MNIIMIGDVLGKSGREAVLNHLPKVMEKLKADFVVVNGENAAHGYGITRKICNEMFEIGVDVVTTGNHVWDQREIIDWIDEEKRLLRPLNFPEGTPGKGYGRFEARNGERVLVLHPMGRLYMDPLDDPFAKMDDAVRNQSLGGSLGAIIVDFHAEATSEKMGMGHFLDGRATVVVGTHTHVPTADAQVLPGGTAFQTDLGMSGDFDSVIGMNKDVAVAKFTRKMPTGRLHPAEGEGTLCGVFVETDERTGLAKRIEPIRVGGRLSASLPTL